MVWKKSKRRRWNASRNTNTRETCWGWFNAQKYCLDNFSGFGILRFRASTCDRTNASARIRSFSSIPSTTPRHRIVPLHRPRSPRTPTRAETPGFRLSQGWQKAPRFVPALDEGANYPPIGVQSKPQSAAQRPPAAACSAGANFSACDAALRPKRYYRSE